MVMEVNTNTNMEKYCTCQYKTVENTSDNVCGLAMTK